MIAMAPSRQILNLPFIALLGMILFLFVIAHVWLLYREFVEWDRSRERVETCIAGSLMTEKLKQIPPFAHFPAPKSRIVVHLRRNMGFIGYEGWTCFGFAEDTDFESYERLVAAQPGTQTDHSLFFDYPMQLPAAFSNLLINDAKTSGTRLTGDEGREQWIFFPKQRHVYSLVID